MDPARYSITFENEPPELLERVQALLDGQGSPAITATRQDGAYVFESPTGEFMLRARVADALTAVWPGWQEPAR